MAAVFGVSLKAVDTWWAKWQAVGREALAMRPQGRPVGVHQVLGEAEQAVLDHRPCDVGLSGQLWTTWGEKGRTPVARRSGNRFSVSAISAISTKGGCTSWSSPRASPPR
ncbi:hypothetical protein ABT403_14005 [Streptomyces sp. NPDC000075]|uniref:hypothetical protein n=1 Tax=Streptomyces TaxID=1883 RepID=UPI0031D35A51